MKAFPAVRLGLLLALAGFGCQPPNPPSEKEEEPKILLVEPSAVADVLPGTWEHSERLQKILGELPKFKIQRITFRRDDAVAKRFTPEIQDALTKHWKDFYLTGTLREVETRAVINGEERRLPAGKEFDFLVHNKDGNMRITYFWQGNWGCYFVNVARGDKSDRDLLFLGGGRHGQTAEAFERVVSEDAPKRKNP